MNRPTLFISSTVYGIEDLLDRMYAILTNFGYDVWMSHKGTIPLRSDRTAFENCLHAVDKCDLFFGLITPSYGSGIDGSDLSITHQEVLRAIEQRKPRWILAHSHVVFARRLLRDLGYDTPEKRNSLSLKKSSKSITDLRVLSMYEDAIRNNEPLAERHGNWVQEYETDEDALVFATAQFSRFQEVESFLQENFQDPSRVMNEIDQGSNKEP